MVTVTGTVGSSGKYLVTAIPIDTHSHCVLKMVFENNTSVAVFGCFEEFKAPTKQQIAETIADRIPVLSLYVPPPRKPWKTADPRMGIFEAAALSWTYSRARCDP